MFDQLFEGFKKASESSLLAQQELMKQWVQQWPGASLNAASSVIDRNSALQKRWIDAAGEIMNRNRELLDATCRAGLRVVEQTARLGEASSPDEYRRMVEDVWRKLFESLKSQAEGQFNELKKASQAWFDVAQAQQKTAAASGQSSQKANA